MGGLNPTDRDLSTAKWKANRRLSWLAPADSPTHLLQNEPKPYSHIKMRHFDRRRSVFITLRWWIRICPLHARTALKNMNWITILAPFDSRLSRSIDLSCASTPSKFGSAENLIWHMAVAPRAIGRYPNLQCLTNLSWSFKNCCWNRTSPYKPYLNVCTH